MQIGGNLRLWRTVPFLYIHEREQLSAMVADNGGSGSKRRKERQRCVICDLQSYGRVLVFGCIYRGTDAGADDGTVLCGRIYGEVKTTGGSYRQRTVRGGIVL